MLQKIVLEWIEKFGFLQFIRNVISYRLTGSPKRTEKASKTNRILHLTTEQGFVRAFTEFWSGFLPASFREFTELC